MLSTDRSAFDEQLEVLFGGFPQFLTPNRKEAFWRGLQKMPLPLFARCVDHVLSEKGDDKLPTPNRIWQISQALRSRPKVEQRSAPPQFDDFHAFGQRCLLVFLQQHPQQADEATLQRLIVEKNKIVTALRAGGFDPNEDAAEVMRTKLKTAFQRAMQVHAA